MSANGKNEADRVPLVVGVGLLAIAALVYWDATNITRAVTYGMGPDAIPKVIAGFVAVLGLAHLVVAFRGGFHIKADELDFGSIGWILFGLVFLIISIPLQIGFIVAMTVLFASTARAFGRRAFVADLVIGFVVGLIVYLVFTKLLTLGLPQGPLERLLS